MSRHFGSSLLASFSLFLVLAQPLSAQGNQILGEVELVGASKVERTSGVWVDGQYVGYLKELKGSKKILLLPGEHEIAVRQDGYQDFTQKITVRPGEKQTISIKMVKDPRFQMPSVSSEMKLSVTPDRAAVFVDGLFVGHVGEFSGAGKSLLVAPGHRKITISLPGYQTFSTEVDLAPNQKFQVKTDLIKEGTAQPLSQSFADGNAAVLWASLNMFTSLKPFLVLLASGLILIQQEAPKSPEANPNSPTISPQQQTASSPSSSAPIQATGISSSKPQALKKEAWGVLQSGSDANKTPDRAAAIHVLGLLKDDRRARTMAEQALSDRAPEVRAAAAAALGDMHAHVSLPKLRTAVDDKDPSVAMAAAHALIQLNDDSGYDVYYEVLTGERKTGKGLGAQAAALKDPKKLEELGFQQGIGFIPFAGLGWKAFKVMKKDDSSPVRAAAATVLTKDPDPKTREALADAAGDKNWIVRAAALEALARRGDPSVLDTVELYLSDQEGEVKYTAAATALRLIAVKESRAARGSRSEKR